MTCKMRLWDDPLGGRPSEYCVLPLGHTGHHQDRYGGYKRWSATAANRLMAVLFVLWLGSVVVTGLVLTGVF